MAALGDFGRAKTPFRKCETAVVGLRASAIGGSELGSREEEEPSLPSNATHFAFRQGSSGASSSDAFAKDVGGKHAAHAANPIVRHHPSVDFETRLSEIEKELRLVAFDVARRCTRFRAGRQTAFVRSSPICRH